MATVGQVSFERWEKEYRSWSPTTKQTLWDHLSRGQQAAWESVATAVRDFDRGMVRTGKCPICDGSLNAEFGCSTCQMDDEELHGRSSYENFEG